MDLLMGLDVGTTATKALVFDQAGNVVASGKYTYGLITPREFWVEQDPEQLWRGVVEAAGQAARQIGPGDRIVAMAQSSQGGTTIPVDADWRPLGNAITWMDQRADEQVRAVEASIGAEAVRRTTGFALMPGLPLQHIAWLRVNCPDLFDAASHFLFVNDFIGQRLTGRLCMNPSDASITQLMGLQDCQWDRRLTDVAGIAPDQLSPIRPSGEVIGPLTASAAKAIGLDGDVLVVNGAHDQYCAAVGTGVTEPGKVLLSCGTAWVILAVPPDLETGLSSGMAVSRHAVQGRWGALRSLRGVGSSLEWLIDNVWGGLDAGPSRHELYAAVDEAAARSVAGAGGLLFVPISGGHTDAGADRGGFVGLTLAHGRADMARAVMEGIAFELRWALDEVRRGGLTAAELKMVGGAAASPVWPGIVAGVTGAAVAVSTVTEAACKGAAILAGVGAGLFADADSGYAAFRDAEDRLEGDQAERDEYDRQFDRYRRAYEMMTTVG